MSSGSENVPPPVPSPNSLEELSVYQNAALVEKQLINSEIVQSENAIQKYLHQSEEFRTNIANRRDAQAEMFAYANERLKEDDKTIDAFEKIIAEALKTDREERIKYDATEAESTAQHAMRCGNYRKEIEACEKEIEEMKQYEDKREGLQADIIALNAICISLDEQLIQQRKHFQEQFQADEREYKRQVEVAMDAAKGEDISITSLQKSDPLLCEKIKQQFQEYKTQTRACKALEVNNEKKEADIKLKREELARVQAKIQKLNRENRTQRKLEISSQDHHDHYQLIADKAIIDYLKEYPNDLDDDIDNGEEEEFLHTPKEEVPFTNQIQNNEMAWQQFDKSLLASPQPPLSADQQRKLQLKEERKKFQAEVRQLEAIENEILQLETPEITALFEAYETYDGNTDIQSQEEAVHFLDHILTKFRQHNVPVPLSLSNADGQDEIPSFHSTKINNKVEHDSFHSVEELVSPMSRSILSYGTYIEDGATYHGDTSISAAKTTAADGSTVQLPKIRSSDSCLLQEDDASTIISRISIASRRSGNSLYTRV